MPALRLTFFFGSWQTGLRRTRSALANSIRRRAKTPSRVSSIGLGLCLDVSIRLLILSTCTHAWIRRHSCSQHSRWPPTWNHLAQAATADVETFLPPPWLSWPTWVFAYDRLGLLKPARPCDEPPCGAIGTVSFGAETEGHNRSAEPRAVA